MRRRLNPESVGKIAQALKERFKADVPLVGKKAIAKACREIWPAMANKSRENILKFAAQEMNIDVIEHSAQERAQARSVRLSMKADFYRNGAWRELRYEAFRRYGANCCLCGRGHKHGVTLHVDHIKPRFLFPELALDIENLQILCEDCNLGKGAKDATDWRSHVERSH